MILERIIKARNEAMKSSATPFNDLKIECGPDAVSEIRSAFRFYMSTGFFRPMTKAELDKMPKVEVVYGMEIVPREEPGIKIIR